MFNTTTIGNEQLRGENRALNACYTFKGDHFEMGREQGRQLKQVVHWCIDLTHRHEAILSHKPWFLPAGLFFKLARIKMERELFPHMTSYVPQHLDRLKGIAVGAEADVGEMAIFQMAEILFSKIDYLQGCSALGVRGKRSATGKPLLAKNFDYPVEFAPSYIFRRSEPEGRMVSLDFGAAVIAGNHDGMNEAGLTILYNYGSADEEGHSLVPITLLCQEALETCKTTREAVALFQRSPRASAALLTVADPSGDMVALEMSPSRVMVREPVDDVLYHTNHYLTPELQAVEVPRDATYGYKAPKRLIGESVFDSSLKRCDRLAELLAGDKALDVEDLKTVLRDTSGEATPNDNTLCREGDYYVTCNALVADVGSHTIHACGGRPNLHPFTPFTF